MAKQKSSNYKSKGQRPNVRKDICKAMRRDYVGSVEQMTNKVRALKTGKRVMMTVLNSNKNNTKERFVRVPMTLGSVKDG